MRIFARIFLSFWLATVLTFAVLLVSDLTGTASVSPDFVRSIPLEQLQKCADTALEQVSPDGLSPILGWLEANQDRCGIEFVVSDTSVEVSGREIPRRLLTLVRQSLTHGTVGVEPFPGRTTVTFPSSNSAHRRYVFVFSIPDREHKSYLPGLIRFLGFALVSAGVCYALTHYLLEPLQRLGLVVEQLGNGNLKARSPTALPLRRDEFGELARTFDRMADRIESLMASQKSFLAHVSHELGSPLTRVNIAVALLRRNSSPEMSPELDRIDQETSELNGLVQQLLLLARLESGNEINRQVALFSIEAVIEEICANATFEAEQIGLRVRVERAEPYSVRGYRDLLKSALDNVLRNALRHSHPGSAVEVHFYPHQDDTRGIIRIRDQGPGIDEAKISTIFEPFVTHNGSGIPSGVGLGLAIARQAVWANGGLISARNMQGGGLMIEIELPLGRE